MCACSKNYPPPKTHTTVETISERAEDYLDIDEMMETDENGSPVASFQSIGERIQILREKILLADDHAASLPIALNVDEVLTSATIDEALSSLKIELDDYAHDMMHQYEKSLKEICAKMPGLISITSAEINSKYETHQCAFEELVQKTEQFFHENFIYAGVHSSPNIPVNLREFIRIGEMSKVDVELVAKHLARVMNKKELDWKQLLSDLHLCFNPQPYHAPPTSFHIPFRQIQDSSEDPIKWSDFVDYLKKNRELQGAFQKAFQKEAQFAQKQVDIPTGRTPDAQIQARLKQEFSNQMEAMKEWAWEADWFDPTESDRKARDFCQQWVLKYVEFFGQTPLDKIYDFPLFRFNQKHEQCVHTATVQPHREKFLQLLKYLYYYLRSLIRHDKGQIIVYRAGAPFNAVSHIKKHIAADQESSQSATRKL